jgi:Protein of unknown function (DUF2817)
MTAEAAASAFSQTYAEARSKFIAAATACGLALQSIAHPLPGRDGEALFLDAARFGASDARLLLIVSSGCHGVEGYCGSGAQTALLADDALHTAAAAAGVSILYLHALNPWGFSHGRRTTEDNVDLNRNWQDFDAKSLPANAGYETLADAIVPSSWPPSAENEAVLMAYAQAHGPKALQAAVSSGQYTHPNGLFFGGHAPTWSRRALAEVLTAQAGACEKLGWIDIHSGLGPIGHGERILAAPHTEEVMRRAQRWWGEAVTSTDEGTSTSAVLTGTVWTAALHCAPQAEYTGIALEFGTVPLDRMIGALRADQWAQNHPEADPALRARIRGALREAFYVDTPQWKAAVVAQTRSAVLDAMAGLSGFAHKASQSIR